MPLRRCRDFPPGDYNQPTHPLGTHSISKMFATHNALTALKDGSVRVALIPPCSILLHNLSLCLFAHGLAFIGPRVETSEVMCFLSTRAPLKLLVPKNPTRSKPQNALGLIRQGYYLYTSLHATGERDRLSDEDESFFGSDVLGLTRKMASTLVKLVASNLLRARPVASSSQFFNTKAFQYVHHDSKDECILKRDEELFTVAQAAINHAFRPLVSPAVNLARLLNTSDELIGFLHWPKKFP
ncbi:hypothetical protein Tco_0994155 [Tanacetum coccineum]